MGYLHFDRVKIPQENLIFNDSSSIQLSSVNKLLREHGIVLKNSEDEEQVAEAAKSSGNFDDFIKNIISIKPSKESMSENETLFSSIPASHNSSLSSEVSCKKDSLDEERHALIDSGNQHLSLSLDEELGWKVSIDSPISSSVSVNNSLENLSPLANSAKTFVKKSPDLDLKQLGAIRQIPGFDKLRSEYQCSMHMIAKRGRGRKLKCCQKADDLFKVALKKKCDSLGIYDYSKYKRRRGRPRKSETSSMTPNFPECNANFSQESDFIPAGSVKDQCNNSGVTDKETVQYKLSLMQKQLQDQQIRLNEQIENMNKNQTPLSGLMLLLQQHQSSMANSSSTSHIQSAPQQLKPLPLNFFNNSMNNFSVPEFNLPSKINYYSQPAGSNNHSINHGNSHYESMLSPISLNTPGMVSPSKFNQSTSISDLTTMLSNDLVNNSNSFPIESNKNDLKSSTDAMHNLPYYNSQNFDEAKLPESQSEKLIDEANTRNTSISAAFDHDQLLEVTENPVEKKKYKIGNKRLHHISGKTIELDPVTHKLKCLHEGCNSQFKQKAYLSRHLKKHSPIKDYVCPFWSSCHSSKNNRLENSNKKSCFEKKLIEKDYMKFVSDKTLNKYISTLKCHSKGYFTRKDEFLVHLKSFHVASDLKEDLDYACCVECGEEFSSANEWYESHINTLHCSKIINKEFNKGRELRRKYEKNIREQKLSN
ncbi:hypothetical protein QEN19_000400 [Hanseniaspora menglaensis]